MKFTAKKLTNIVMVLVIILGITKLVSAQEIAKQINSVVEAQTIVKSLLSRLSGYEAAEPQFEVLAVQPVYKCLDNYTSWPSSATANMNHEWSRFTQTNLYPSNQAITDLNGDGLVDYVYLSSGSGSRGICVYLNNGTGFELAYRCYRYVATGGATTYYGDCVATSN